MAPACTAFADGCRSAGLGYFTQRGGQCVVHTGDEVRLMREVEVVCDLGAQAPGRLAQPLTSGARTFGRRKIESRGKKLKCHDSEKTRSAIARAS
jgi:hypothetical protein